MDFETMNSDRGERHSVFTSACCGGETCVVCGEPAAAKIGEEIMPDDPLPHRHNLTAYVCREHFAMLFHPAQGGTPRKE